MQITIIKPYAEIVTPIEHIRQFPKLLEMAGRICYKSEDKITPTSSQKFIQMILKSGHESVLEHCSITAKIVGDRSMSHQLVRHRISSFSQESQRYCNYGKKGFTFICPPTIQENAEGIYVEHPPDKWMLQNPKDFNQTRNARFWRWLDLRKIECEEYEREIEEKIPPEDARSNLPNATKTEVVTTFNLRQWRHVFKERALNAKAQWQIKEIMMSLLTQFQELLPDIFGDLNC